MLADCSSLSKISELKYESIIYCLLLKADSQILHSNIDILKFVSHQILLLCKFLRLWVLSKFDCFNKCLIESFCQYISSFYFNGVISQANKVCNQLYFMPKIDEQYFDSINHIHLHHNSF